MLKSRHYIKGDWPRFAVMYCLKERLRSYLLKHEKMPPVLYASSNMGNLYPYDLCGFAIKHKMMLKFIPRKGYEDPWFCFGTEEDGYVL